MSFVCNQLSIPHEICNLFAINYQFHMKFVVYFESISNIIICHLFRIILQFDLRYVIYILELIINSNW